MFREFMRKNKYLDYINIHNREVIISIILTVILLYIAIRVDIFNNFTSVRAAFQNISIYIASGLLAMIGIILTGLALMLGLLDRKLLKEISSLNKDMVNDLMLCFKFLIVNLGFSSILFFFIHFMLFVDNYVSKIPFYSIVGLLIYYFVFLVFYTIDLIASSIDLYLIKNITDETDKMEFNNIQNNFSYYIDKIKLEYLMRHHNAESHKTFFKNIDEVIDDIKDIDEVAKAKLKKIFRDVYNNK